MKALLGIAVFLLLKPSSETFLVVDRNLKKPATHANYFTTALYLQRNFPVYTNEIETLSQATDKAVKKLDAGFTCNDFEKIEAGHTTIVIQQRCDETKQLSITLVTRMEETKTSFSFALVANETELQKAQRRVLDFATYINQ